jgi:hypothetical protein
MLSASLPLVRSPTLLAEYRSVMLRPKVAVRWGLLAHEACNNFTDIARHAAMLQPSPPASSLGKAPDTGDQMRRDWLALRPDPVLANGDPH